MLQGQAPVPARADAVIDVARPFLKTHQNFRGTRRNDPRRNDRDVTSRDDDRVIWIVGSGIVVVRRAGTGLPIRAAPHRPL